MGTMCTTTALSVKMVGTVFDTATSALASACIDDAEAEIKKYLSSKYDFTAAPFISATSMPPAIKLIAETLSLGYMYENMARGSKDGYARADRYINRAMQNLKDLAEGEASLVDATGADVDELEGDWTIYATTEYPPTFNEDDPHNWKVSTDKLEDISDDRDE